LARSPCSSNRLEVELEGSGCNDARERDARRYREEREAFRSHKERPADDGPSEEGMNRAQLQRIQDALDVLQTQETCLSYIDCYACGGRIPELADDIVLGSARPV
jgi:hypothetical protein